ncbi:MAG: alpha/beta hydrolase [Actinomycetota bacterium]
MASEQIQGIITMLRSTAEQRGDAEEMTVEQWREAYAGLGAMLPAREGVVVTPVDAGGVPAEWIGDDDGPVVVYLHGGGYCIGSLETHRAMLTHLAAAIPGRVLAVDYRLAPEHPHPAALDDAVAAYRFALSDGVVPDHVVVAGDSAGGGLTLATLVALRDTGVPLPAAGVCLSPWADLTQSGATIATHAEADPMVRAADLDRWAEAYRGTAAAGSPAISPLFGDLAGLPPLHIEVGTAEVLLDDARRVTAAARAAGVEVELHEAEDMIHVWQFFAGIVPEADEAIARIAAFVTARAA